MQHNIFSRMNNRHIYLKTFVFSNLFILLKMLYLETQYLAKLKYITVYGTENCLDKPIRFILPSLKKEII